MYEEDPSPAVNRSAFDTLCYNLSVGKGGKKTEQSIFDSSNAIFPSGVVILAFSQVSQRCQPIWDRIQETHDLGFLEETYDLAWTAAKNRGERNFLHDIIAKRCATLVTKYGEGVTYAPILANIYFYEHSPQAAKHVVDVAMKALRLHEHFSTDLFNALVSVIKDSRASVRAYATASILQSYMLNHAMSTAKFVAIKKRTEIPSVELQRVSEYLKEWGVDGEILARLSLEEQHQVRLVKDWIDVDMLVRHLRASK